MTQQLLHAQDVVLGTEAASGGPFPELTEPSLVERAVPFVGAFILGSVLAFGVSFVVRR